MLATFITAAITGGIAVLILWGIHALLVRTVGGKRAEEIMARLRGDKK
ncbi:MAG TPA: hypothetical protein VMW72_14160 [Sedimentisphaerales bacterium]|nr:hypothetical protein [Sedimentisphaerales bacterium]